MERARESEVCSAGEHVGGAQGAKKLGYLPWAHLRLPPFPHVAMRVLQLVHREDVQLTQISELIASDPAFASEVLTVANSPLYALRYSAHSILQAVSILGGNALQGMCVTVGVRAYLGKSMSHPSMKILWRHNLACAIVAQQLAESGSIDRDTAYTAGILHDIGRAALSVIQPREYSKLLAAHKGPAMGLLESERELFGVDHCEAGMQLIADWKLPPEFEAVIAGHHDPIVPGAEFNLGELVKVSCAISDAAGFAAAPGCEPIAYDELRAGLPHEVSAQLDPDPTVLAEKIGEAIRHIETV